jgi:hypothetical protein
MQRLVAPLVVLVALAAATPAWAGDTAACVAAAEEGQRARKAGKLRDAIERFTACGSDACPRLVRDDCRQWQDELDASLPTLVFGARDRAGRDLLDVTVTMDGEVLTGKLDGRAIAVDPGPREIRFEAPGLPAVVQAVLVKEGEKSRVVSVTFGGSERPASAAVAASPTPTAEVPRRGHTLYPWLLVGAGAIVGVTGALVLLTSPTRPSNCSADSRTCTRSPGETDAELEEEQTRAGNADTQPRIGLALVGAGVLVAGAGLLWHFLEPSGRSRGARTELLPAPRGYGGRFMIRF